MPIFFVRAPEKNRQNILSQKQLSRVCKKCVKKNSTILFFELATRIVCQKKLGFFFLAVLANIPTLFFYRRGKRPIMTDRKQRAKKRTGT